MIAPLEKPIAMGALGSLYCVEAASMKSARITAREAMSASSIDRSAKRWKNANPPSNGMPPRTARIGDPGARSAASGTSSCSLPPDPCSSTSGGLAGQEPGMKWWTWAIAIIEGTDQVRTEITNPDPQQRDTVVQPSSPSR